LIRLIPVINGAIEIATKGLKKNMEAIPVKNSIDSLQRQVYLEHHILYGKYCSMKLGSTSGGDQLWFKRRSTRKKRPLKEETTTTRIHEVKELQKTVILGTAHILRKVLM
jgi:hypothetical protein